MDVMAACLSCLIATLNEQLSCHLVSVTLNRKASSVADRLCEKHLVRRKNSIAVLSCLLQRVISATSLQQYKLKLL